MTVELAIRDVAGWERHGGMTITCPVHGDLGGAIDPTRRIGPRNRCRICLVEALRAMVALFGHERASELYVADYLNASPAPTLRRAPRPTISPLGRAPRGASAPTEYDGPAGTDLGRDVRRQGQEVASIDAR